MRICVVIVMVQGHVCAWRNRLLEEAVRGAPYCSLKLAASRRSPPSLCSSPSLIPLLLVQFYMSSASYASSTPHLTPPANRLGALRDLLRRQAILHNRPSTHQELCVLLDQLLAQHRSGNSTEGMSHKHSTRPFCFAKRFPQLLATRKIYTSKGLISLRWVALEKGNMARYVHVISSLVRGSR